MLFLAVFCGFLAENQREHMVEHQREKEYMKSMLDDLKLDIAEVNRGIGSINNFFIPVLNKSTALLYSENFSDSTISEMYATVPKALKFFTITLQDNTVTQLKNSGNLRLVRNKEVTDSLAKYWNLCDYLKNTLIANYEIARLNSKELTYSLFNYHYFENNNPAGLLQKKGSLKLMSNDKVQFIKLGNYFSNLNNQLTNSISERLININQNAVSLIDLIQKEYHIE